MKEVLKARSPRQNLPLFRSLVAVAVVSKRRPYLLSGVSSTNGVSFLTFKERIGIPFKIDHSPAAFFVCIKAVPSSFSEERHLQARYLYVL